MGYRFCHNCDHEFYEADMVGNKCPQCRTDKWGLLHPLQAKAHGMVSRAVLSGRITKVPCEVCGSTVRVEGHHDDYSKPLEVIWLCRPHHGQRHAELRLAGKDPNSAIRFKHKDNQSKPKSKRRKGR